MEELTAAQIAELKAGVQQRCQELENFIAASTESSKPVALDSPIGRLSRMDAMQQQQMAVASRDGHLQRLSLLRNALQALGRNDYGFCRSCEEPIGYRRLRAQPESSLCLACQSIAEGGS